MSDIYRKLEELSWNIRDLAAALEASGDSAGAEGLSRALAIVEYVKRSLSSSEEAKGTDL